MPIPDDPREGSAPLSGSGSAARTALSTFGAVAKPLQEFFRLEAASGILLLAAAVVALVWANSPLSDSYGQVFGTTLSLGAGGSVIRVSLRQLINDGLMTVFFFQVGMEIISITCAGVKDGGSTRDGKHDLC